MDFIIIYWNKIIIYIYKTALYTAVINKDIEMVKLLLSNDSIDVNVLNISKYSLNSISHYIFQLHF